MIRFRCGWLATGLLVGSAGWDALAQEPDRARAATEAASQANEADRLLKLGEFASALPLYEAERTSRATIGDTRYEAYALRAIGICRAELSDDLAAIAAWKQARELDLKRDDPGFAGYDDFLIAQAEARLGRPAAAIQTLEQAMPRMTGVADRDHEIDARLVMTRLLVGSGQSDRARPHATRALELAEELKDPWRIGDAWASLGQVEGTSGRAEAALEDFGKASKLFEQQGRAAEAAWMETTSASALILLNRPDQALARYEQAARLHKHLRDGGSTSEDLAAVAGLHLEAARLDQALAAATEAVDQARDADDREREVEARVRLAQVQGAQNHWDEAARTLDEAVILGRQVARDNPFEQVRILLTAAATDARAGLNERMDDRLKVASQLALDAKSPDLERIVAQAAASIRTMNLKHAPDAPIPPPRPIPPQPNT